MPTPLRNIRVPDDIWEAAKVKAELNGTTVSAVLIASLRRYVKNDGRPGK